MALIKRHYKDTETVITAENLNDIQDAVIMLEDGLFSIDNDKSGEVITITDAAKRGFRSLNIYGKTTQDGTPTPENPVELVSVGNGGSITVNVTGENKAQSMTIATPNGLPGIPVTSGGNYTDANGQQWICNEVDFAQRKIIVRVAVETIAKSNTFIETADYPGRFVCTGIISGKYKNGSAKAVSNFAKWAEWGAGKQGDAWFAVNLSSLYYYPTTTMTVDEVNALFAEMIASGTPPIVVAQLATPIETPLSEEEIAAYASLHTYKDNTTVSNDAGAYMELDYVMDAKKYIDNLFASISAPAAKITNVTLKASAWIGSNSLYSQVLSIDGITQYSKVDLQPSVEQLAIFYNKDVAFVTENDNGVVTAFAIGDKPTNDYVIQASITEVQV